MVAGNVGAALRGDPLPVGPGAPGWKGPGKALPEGGRRLGGN